MALPLYAITLFVSAFILFLVQPIIGKIILPKLGGTPQVWNTCMVFFQMVLLAGYAYTHNVSTRLNLRQQLMAHALLLLLPLIVLLPFPFAFMGFEGPRSEHSIWAFVPDLGSNPIPSTLKILFTYVALPFLVVATSAPLLQKWFVHTGHPAAKDPYFLYGASNFGSMLSLILYPILIEPLVSLSNQGWLYAGGYLLLILCVIACASMVWTSKDASASPKHGHGHGHSHDPKPETAPAAPHTTTPAVDTGVAAGAPPASTTPAAPTGIKSGQPGKQPVKAGARVHGTTEPSVAITSDELTFGRRFRWVMLAAIPSSLMLGITTHITTDLSPMPLFWLIPLILYLLSFILVFARWPVVWTEQPHNYMLYAQPVCIWLMIMTDVWNLTSEPTYIGIAIIAHVLGFFTTTMVCHGELAKDRPGTKHLTEFFLWMSVGGMVGGMFNALIAPIIFPKLWEFPLAIFAAALVRPRMFDVGLFDNWMAGILEGSGEAPAAAAAKPGHKGHHKQHPVHRAPQTASESLVQKLDWAWPLGVLILTGALVLFMGEAIATARVATTKIGLTMVAFGIPLALSCLCVSRPMRMGLGVGAVLLLSNLQEGRSNPSVYSSRSYFGIISVKQNSMRLEDKETVVVFRQLVHGHINHGLNYEVPPAGKKSYRGDPNKDFSRLATTYYHREGPVGRVMEKFNWFDKGPPNTYDADARMPVSLIGNIAADIGVAALPITELVTLWSEPPIATVGLGTGTMASYGRPYQHVHFYEIDNQILRLSLLQQTRNIRNFKEYEEFKQNSRKETYFNYLERAIERGCTVQVLMGDARLRMAMPYKNHYEDETDRGGGPNNFYHMMVVDAFSSDAIPAHLLTEEAFEMYFKKLTEKGILCVHTSNRFVDLPKVVAAVASKLNLKHLRGHDVNDERGIGHYTSEWVMVARKGEYMSHLSDDTEFLARYRESPKAKNAGPYWDSVSIDPRFVWTDDYYNLMSVVRFR